MTSEILSADPIAELRKKNYNATIAKIIATESDSWRIRVKPDQPLPDYQPGQYNTIGIGNWETRHSKAAPEILDEKKKAQLVRRAYSVSHPILNLKTKKLFRSDEVDFYEFYINLVLEGPNPAKPPAFTPRLFNLKEGDRVAIGPKFIGKYTLESVDCSKNPSILFLGTGTGEAPHNAMIWKLLSKGYKGNLISIVCTRYLADQAYREIHRELEKQFSTYHYITLATRENKGKEKVYIQDLFEKNLLEKQLNWKPDSKNTHIFLCGNPAMIGHPKKDESGNKIYPTPKGMVEILEERGFVVDTATQKGNIHFESYW